MRYLGLILIAIISCDTQTSDGKDLGVDVRGVDTEKVDTITVIDVKDQSATDLKDDPFDPGPTPTEKLRPKFGELSFYQLELPPGLVPKLGEAGIIVGPKGSIALLDIGNSSHDDEVRDAIRDLNTNWLTPEFGFSQRDALQVEWIILTHIHGDHLGAFENLLVKEELTGIQGIVHRGFVDLGPGMNERDYETFCEGMRGKYAAINYSICNSVADAPCDRDVAQAHEASNCDGLLVGDLADASDDLSKKKTFIDLDGAKIELIGANAHFHNGVDIAKSSPFGNSHGSEENARSLVGIIRFGKFTYHFGGDLHGVDDGNGPDIESFLVDTSSGFYGELGVDVVHSHHHGRKTSSNPNFVNMVAPNDGRSRNVIAGISLPHIGSPDQEVVLAWELNGRLGLGHLWITRNTPTGGTSPKIIDANGSLAIQTIQSGRGYWIQAVGDEIVSKSYESVR